MNNTRDISKFGHREITQAIELLKAYNNTNMTTLAKRRFVDEGVTVEFNPDSGVVFLTNDEYQVLMLNREVAGYEQPLLDLWLYSPHDGNEGFVEDIARLYKDGDLCGDDEAYFEEMLEDVEPCRQEEIGGLLE